METKELTKNALIAVHADEFHADEVFAIAILKLIEPTIKIIRTRDKEEYDKADFRVDVGTDYNPKAGNFDHHQEESAGARKNGLPYASCGLIWKHYGGKILDNNSAHNMIDKYIIQQIDAGDCGIDPAENMDFIPYTMGHAIHSFNPPWDSKKKHDEQFHIAVKFAMVILQNEIEKAKSMIAATSLVNKAIKERKEKEILVLDDYVSWKHVMGRHPEIMYVVYPSLTKGWHARCVPSREGSFASRKDFPEKWAGKREDELAEITGVKDAIFCHKSRFIVAAKSKEGALKLVKLALENNSNNK